MSKIIINHGEKVLTTENGVTLVAALAEHKLVLPSACGGHGRCGLCRVRVFRGGSPLTEFEEKRFTPEQLANKWRLACQVQIDGDLEIMLPGQLIGAPIYECAVEAITDLTYDIKGLRLKMPAGHALNFRPGQYMQVTVPPYKNTKQSAYRAYSLASPPSQKEVFEFCIRRLPNNGIVTTYIFDHLQVGDKLSLTGPYGDFYLRDDGSGMGREIIFIAGSSGISPIRSMMYDLVSKNNQRRATFIFGGGSEKDLFYVDQFRQWERENQWFKYLPTLNENTAGYACGLVTTAIEKELGDLTNTEAYMCGNPGMLNACVEVLKNKNMPEDQIFYDKFA